MYPVLAPTHDDDWRDAYPLRYFNGAGPRHLRVPVTLRPHQSYSFTRGGWHFMAIDDACYRDTAHCSTARWRLGPGRPGRPSRRLHDRATGTAVLDEPDPDPRPRAGDADDHAGALRRRRGARPQRAPARLRALRPRSDPDGVRDDARGIRSFIVGTGGIGFYPWTGTAPNSVTKQTGTYGVLDLTLRAGSYGWRFQPTSGGTYTDPAPAPAAVPMAVAARPRAA